MSAPMTRLTDEAIERRLLALAEVLAPDPLFRRRLRGEAVNHYVAAREGLATTARPGVLAREMGRLGRACLYASLALGVTAAGVLGASQDATPGHPLYSLKLRIEQLRVEVLPQHLHEELSASMLTQRIEEMRRLVEAGEWSLAMALTPTIEAEYHRLLDLRGSGARGVDLARHLVVLEAVIDQLPEAAREAVQRVIDGHPAIDRGPARPSRGPTDDERPNGAGGPNAGTGAGVDHEPRPSASPKPDHTPKPTLRPARTPRSLASPSPSPTPTASPEDAESDSGD